MPHNVRVVPRWRRRVAPPRKRRAPTRCYGRGGIGCERCHLAFIVSARPIQRATQRRLQRRAL